MLHCNYNQTNKENKTHSLKVSIFPREDLFKISKRMQTASK